MFDVSASEILVIGAVALIVIGPKELPGVLRMVGQTVGKLKRMAGDFRQQFDDAMREADLHDIKKTVSDTVDTASAATSFNPISTIRNEIRSTVDDLKSAARVADADAASAVLANPEAAKAAAPLPITPTVAAEQGPPVSALTPVAEFPAPPPPAEPAVLRIATGGVEDEEPPAKPRRTRKKPAGSAE